MSYYRASDEYFRRFNWRRFRFEWGRWEYWVGLDGIDEWEWVLRPEAALKGNGEGDEYNGE